MFPVALLLVPLTASATATATASASASAIVTYKQTLTKRIVARFTSTKLATD